MRMSVTLPKASAEAGWVSGFVSAGNGGWVALPSSSPSCPDVPSSCPVGDADVGDAEVGGELLLDVAVCSPSPLPHPASRPPNSTTTATALRTTHPFLRE